MIADGHAGLAKAVRRLLPEAKRQRCVVHFERNVLAKAPARLRWRLGKEVSAIYDAPSLTEAKKRVRNAEFLTR